MGAFEDVNLGHLTSHDILVEPNCKQLSVPSIVQTRTAGYKGVSPQVT